MLQDSALSPSSDVWDQGGGWRFRFCLAHLSVCLSLAESGRATHPSGTSTLSMVSLSILSPSFPTLGKGMISTIESMKRHKSERNKAHATDTSYTRYDNTPALTLIRAAFPSPRTWWEAQVHIWLVVLIFVYRREPWPRLHTCRSHLLMWEELQFLR